MKNYTRKALSLLLAMLLLVTGLPAVTVSEEAITAGSAGAQISAIVDADTAEGAGSEEAGNDAEPIIFESEVLPTDLPGSDVDSTRDASYSPAFILGYAQLLEAATVDGTALAEGAIVYVFDRALDDTMTVCADTADGVKLGTLTAVQLRPLSEAETIEVTEKYLGVYGVNYFDAEETVPLYPNAGLKEIPEATEGTEPETEAEENAEEEVVTETTPEPVYEIEVETEPANTEEVEPEATESETTEATESETEENAESAVVTEATPEPMPELTVEITEETEEEDELPVPEIEDISRKITNYSTPIEIMEGESLQGEKVSGATWYSEDDTIASISTTGLLYGESEGVTYVCEELSSGDIRRWRVIVYAAVSYMDINETELYLGQGEQFQLEAIFPSGEYGVVTWKSNYSKYISVDQSGLVTAIKGNRSAIITATCGTEVVTCTVKTSDAPSKIRIEPNDVYIGVGQILEIEPYLYGRYSNELHIELDKAFSTSALDEISDGVFEGMEKGTARVKVTTYNGKTAYCTVKVSDAPDDVQLNEHYIQMGEGQTADLEAIIPADTYTTLTWDSTDKSVVAVNNNGKLTAKSAGNATITVETHNGFSDVCDVDVLPAPDYVDLNETSILLGVGETFQLEEVLPAGCAGSVTWKTSSKSYATVSNTGLVKGVKAGTAKITVTTYNGLTATCTVKVLKSPSSVSISSTKLMLVEGTTRALSASYPSGTYTSSVTWTSDDPSIAEVDSDTGDVYAWNVGETKVHVTTGNGKTAACTVTVVPVPTYVAFEVPEVTIGVGETFQTKVVADNGMTDMEYASDDDSIVSVNKSGVISGKAEGDVYVYASLVGYASCYDYVLVHVIEAPTDIIIYDTSITLGAGETYSIYAEADNGFSQLTWTSSSPKYASVDEYGNLTALKAGSTTIRCKTYNGITKSVKVKVKAAPTYVKLTPAESMISVGEGFKLTTKTSSGVSATLTSDDPYVATVNAAGDVVGVHGGTTTITAETYNGLTATAIVHVYTAPTSIGLNETVLDMGKGQTKQLTVAYNSGEYAPITWSSSNTKVATVSSTGLVKCVAGGTAVIRAQTTIPGVYETCTVTVWDAPTSVTLPESEVMLEPGDTYQIIPIIPATSRTEFTYASADPTIASVDDTGLVTAIRHGKVKIGVKTSNGKTAYLTVNVYDKYMPTKVTISGILTTLEPEETMALTATVEPSTAIPELKWSSSNIKVATVDEYGLVTAIACGSTTISVVSDRNPDCKASFKLTVQDGSLVLDVPAWTTPKSSAAISARLNEQTAIYDCAINQLDMMVAAGEITATDASRREDAISEAFKDLKFPWITNSYQGYWKDANSEGGVKDFKTDRVYFGVPYTSNSDTRKYNVSKLVSGNYYTKSGSGYYVLNTSRYDGRKYNGNDCSSFVCQAFFGTGSSNSYLVTSSIYSTSSFKDISYDKLRAGDIIVKKGHVVMFLYWADEAHTAMMIIENGGTEAGTNTVHCDIYPRSYYVGDGYKARRLSTLAS